MHDANDHGTTAVQAAETLSEKKRRAATIRWTKQRALELGLTLLGESSQQTPVIKPAPPPPPTDPAEWQAKLREVFWAGLLDADEKVLGYLAKLFNISLVEEIDLQLTPDEIELIRRHRRFKALDPDAQHKELEANLTHLNFLEKWRAGWQWVEAIQAYRPRTESYFCPHCQNRLYDYETHHAKALANAGRTTTPKPPAEAHEPDSLSPSVGTVQCASARAITDELTLDLTPPIPEEPATAKPTHQPYAVCLPTGPVVGGKVLGSE